MLLSSLPFLIISVVVISSLFILLLQLALDLPWSKKSLLQAAPSRAPRWELRKSATQYGAIGNSAYRVSEGRK